ncbi:hypothetical protein HCUR_00543 [Holospora curviuscula]|uniref:Uncharacterized protein n=1 Tax=Holospora curviuscula TaxID=1082868 RepID=A0A2S5R9L6_9PROT|nr:hypothetical protein HCUR_00543 [Holospora curviuscula]
MHYPFMKNLKLNHICIVFFVGIFILEECVHAVSHGQEPNPQTLGGRYAQFFSSFSSTFQF